MTQEQPKKIAASVRQRLLNISRQQGEDFQLVLIRYALERLLYRISNSEYRDQFILKGAMLFQIWSQQSHRPTRDIDFLGQGEHSESRYQKIFEDICKIDAQPDGLEFVGKSIRVSTTKENEKYQGIRVTLQSLLGSARIPIQVDIGFGDAITPGPIDIEYPTILDFDAPRLKSYPRETVVAEKYQAMVVLGITNSRMKDFFDIWSLCEQFEFEGVNLCNAILATFKRRDTELPDGRPIAMSREFFDDQQKQTQWHAFISRSGLTSESLLLASVINKLEQFLLPPTAAVRNGQTLSKQWLPGGPWLASPAENR